VKCCSSARATRYRSWRSSIAVAYKSETYYALDI
jgi:hypothetical protein